MIRYINILNIIILNWITNWI